MVNNDKIFENGFAYLPVLRIRNIVAIPNMVLNIDVGRKKSSMAITTATDSDKYIFITTQKNINDDDPKQEDLYKIGCIAKVRSAMRSHGSDMRTSLECICRACFSGEMVDENGTLFVRVKVIPETPCDEKDFKEAAAFIRKVTDTFDEYASYFEKMSPEVLLKVHTFSDAGLLADYIAQNIYLKYSDKQIILATIDPIERLKELLLYLLREIEICKIEEKISNKVKFKITKNQRDFYLREQLKVLQEELYEDSDEDMDGFMSSMSGNDDEKYFLQIENSKMPKVCKEKLIKETNKLMKLPTSSQESALIQNYLDECLNLPWEKYSKDEIDIAKAEKILNKDHYGLEKIKERIIETLAVKKLNPENRGQILCLVGPPGTGKTSIAASVAKAMHRKFVRVSLGGVHDESEIRGHRKTYLGSMPGKIIDAVIESGVQNPVILLDEVDKMGADYKGDPSAALLEVLDPEQNKTFKDHYIDMPFDLSKVFFITTANVVDTIPAPLYDRMDIIELSSYTHEEKFNIAKKHLLQKQLKKHGLTAKTLKISDDAINDIIRYYTKEAGVRRLEKTIADICRKAAKTIVTNPPKTAILITSSNIKDYLGPKKFKQDSMPEHDKIGVVTGLAYTTVGGEIMPLEVAVMSGTGKIELTGSLGDVMKESAKAAISYIRANADKYGIDHNFYKEKDIHIHAPEGAIPKDGPSAGCAMATALLSELTKTKIRNDVAMTGEITIRGTVLPIGGLKEKTMAAYKAGAKTVIIPEDNKSDIEELADVVKENITFVTASQIDQVFNIAFRHQPKQIPTLTITEVQ